ncbi:MAG: UDP-N-acetylmuramate--L-alanine ligase [Acidobacteriota bacterium]|nr:UDP-N-acetylmuramate--L-alanine ligase [Acidobacteriota bacterium]
MFRGVGRIHFTGIGGIGMSGIAELLINLGCRVSGSDLRQGPVIDNLRRLGGDVRIGHAAENVCGAEVVVVSSAVRADNPEVVEARRLQIPVIPRAEMLAELMRLKYGVAVAGSHGKTTTTSMIATVLVAGGLDPTAVIGGRLNAFGSNAKLGAGDFLVAEADESDGSFLKLSPTVAVVTNIDREHLDHYADLGELRAAFAAFANKVPFYGAAVLCLDDPNVQSILPKVERRVVTYGFAGQADVSASHMEVNGFGSSFHVRYKGAPLGTVSLRVPGRHGALNALAAVATALELGIPFKDTAAALAGFQNADRRFQVKGERGGALVVDDYGHHPTEVVATLGAARRSCERRIVAVFQPHRYSRTQALEEEFSHAFNDADVLIVLPIYAAGEDAIPGVSSERLVERIKQSGHRDVAFAPGHEAALAVLHGRAKDGDLVLTLGAGDVWKVGEAFLKGTSENLADKASPQVEKRSLPG